MARPRTNFDNILVVAGLVLLFSGLKKYIDNDGFTKDIGYFLLSGGAILVAGIIDPLLCSSSKGKAKGSSD